MKFQLQPPPAALLARSHSGTTVHLVEPAYLGLLQEWPPSGRGFCGAKVEVLVADDAEAMELAAALLGDVERTYKRCQKCQSNEWSDARKRRTIR